ncbi:DUF7674 family protein [Zooshikella ganghwensis]|uniref:DUF7674 domain-containing protein n=1 Tax=Zooshikella ganghwensis TaxID=202772 RepID=A0A4V1IMR8_9GAMM|nr:hypothetical protein [Zooshikella ganghwensis]RDH41181.1 hypothetical protein B9G39_29710 [Zooshikella ganghwensis]
MPILDMYNQFRETFPDLTEKTDKEHIRRWSEVDPDFAYSWFESLANALNNEMNKKISVSKYSEVFEFIRSHFMNGNKEARNCIDVAFTENLFWQVKPENAKPYWDALPNVLKELYVDFHNRKPF